MNRRLPSRPLTSLTAPLVLIVPLIFGACSSGDETQNDIDNPHPSFTSGGGSPPATGGAFDGATGGLPSIIDGSGGDSATGGNSSATGGALATGGAASTSALVIEEEQPGHCSVDGVVEASNAGFSGVGYLNTDNATGSAITWSIVVGEAGIYSLNFVHANAGTERTAQILIDEMPATEQASFPSTTDWTTWTTISVDVPLSVGTHTIALKATDASGLANIDRLEITGANVTPGECSPTDPDGPGPDGTEPITVWLAGDSTVANGSTPCPSGWGKFFANELNNNVTVKNWAVGGRSVRTWLYDVTNTMGGDGECVINVDSSGKRVVQSRWTDMLAQMNKGDYLLIQFGINDGSATCNRHVGGAAFKEEYAMMAQAAVERSVQPVFLTPVSAIRCSGNTAVASRGFLKETFDVGTAEGVPVIDLHQLSIDLYQARGFCPAAAGGVSGNTGGPVGDFFCDDHTHFSDVGGAQIAKLVANEIASSNLGLAAYLK